MTVAVLLLVRGYSGTYIQQNRDSHGADSAGTGTPISPDNRFQLITHLDRRNRGACHRGRVPLPKIDFLLNFGHLATSYSVV